MRKNELIKIQSYVSHFLLFVLFVSAISFIHADVVEEKLRVYESMKIGPCMDVAIEGDYAYIIGNGKLYVADISNAGSPDIRGSISGLGNVRQILLKEGAAYIASREDGVFIIDVRNPAKPKLLCHYNSVEVATGIGISGKVMFIANRGHGVEIVDASDPRNPEFLSIVRSGESQSVDIREGFLYIGVHGAKYLVTADVRNPRKPVITSRIKLDGQGDGIYVQGDYLFISTGNRSRASPSKKEGDPGYGTGHGLEIYELSNPAKPVFVSRVKFDILHAIPDLWNVEVSGNYAFCSDAHNGMYIVEVKNIKNPKVIAHFPISHISSENRKNYSGGLAVVDDYIYVAGGKSDLHIVQAKGMAKKQRRVHDDSIKVGRKDNKNPKDYRLLMPPGQVWGVDIVGDFGVAACGMAGWCSFTIGPQSKIIKMFESDGFALCIAVHSNYVFVATSKGKVDVWKHNGTGNFDQISSYKASRNAAIKTFVIPPGVEYALMQVGMGSLEFVDISNPEKPVRALLYKSSGYINQIVGNYLLDNRYAYAGWHTKGIDWFDLKNRKPVYTGKTLHGRGFKGVCAFDDKLIIFTHSGYKIVNYDDENLDEIKEKKLDRSSVGGSSIVYGKTIISSNRAGGYVSVLDMSDIENAKVVKTISTSANPGTVSIYKDKLIIPDGYGGIRIYDDFFNKRLPAK